MRIELPKNVERFGSISFGGLQKVFELDSGMDNGYEPDPRNVIQAIPYSKLLEIYKDMAIVVPVRDERLKLIEGVLCGIPHPCLIIVISNSNRGSVDRFKMEQDALRDFCTFTKKQALIAHQKDKRLGRAFERTGYSAILGKDGLIRSGKAEGMLAATMLAKIAGKKYIGFVDSDNYFPGSVEEYVREYAAGFFLSRSSYSMVRIVWHSKPKIVESKLFFRKWGRTSMNTNTYLNKLIAHYTGFETEIIKTGNAGEHAISMDLAMNIDYSSGYSIEPYHIINLLERFGGIVESPVNEIMQDNVEVFQIESRNPHLHESGDTEHIDQMSYLAMQVLYHSYICPEKLKKELLRAMVARGYVAPKKKPKKPRYFPALSCINEAQFLRAIGAAPYAKLIREGIGKPV
jgi:mannosyl-3-phosphoglycerate synthase